jgi:phosphohistidine phosphatase
VKLLVIRHAIAADRDAFATTGRDDDQRPLTSRGRRRMVRIARGLRRLVPRLAALGTSPLTRARQTADIVAGAFDVDDVLVTEVLRPGAPLADAAAWLGERARAVASDAREPVLAIVGHEPHLGSLVTWLAAGIDQPGIALRKGGACLLAIDDEPARAAATLHWLLTPKQLRRIGPAG